MKGAVESSELCRPQFKITFDFDLESANSFRIIISTNVSKETHRCLCKYVYVGTFSNLCRTDAILAALCVDQIFI